MKQHILSLSLLISTIALHAADDEDNRIIGKDCEPVFASVVKMVRLRDISPISEQLLKDEISRYTVPVIRQRMQDASRGIGEQVEGRMCPKITWLTFTRTFHQGQTSDLAKNIFDIVNKNEQQNGPTPHMYTLEIPRTIDIFTDYEKISHSDGTFSVKCITKLSSKSYIEEVIAEIP